MVCNGRFSLRSSSTCLTNCSGQSKLVTNSRFFGSILSFGLLREQLQGDIIFANELDRRYGDAGILSLSLVRFMPCSRGIYKADD
jgi:hypothetical protein